MALGQTLNARNLTKQPWKFFRFLDPLFFGDYPLSMKSLVGERLPKISRGTAKFLTGTLDFVGMNHYTSLYARNDRFRIRKLIFNDASTDSNVIPTRKLLRQSSSPYSYIRTHNFANCTYWYGYKSQVECNPSLFNKRSIAAHRGVSTIGERVCLEHIWIPGASLIYSTWSELIYTSFSRQLPAGYTLFHGAFGNWQFIWNISIGTHQ